MPEDESGVDRDLRVAAEVFLRGPVTVGTRSGARVTIGDEAVDRVVATLAACGPDAVTVIRRAVDWHRRVGTSASREDLIDAVTAAVVQSGRVDAKGNQETGVGHG